MTTKEKLQAALEHTLEGTDFKGLGSCMRGKVRDSYTKDGKRLPYGKGRGQG